MICPRSHGGLITKPQQKQYFQGPFFCTPPFFQKRPFSELSSGLRALCRKEKKTEVDGRDEGEYLWRVPVVVMLQNPTKKSDSQCRGLGKKERACLFNGYTDLE